MKAYIFKAIFIVSFQLLFLTACAQTREKTSTPLLKSNLNSVKEKVASPNRNAINAVIRDQRNINRRLDDIYKAITDQERGFLIQKQKTYDTSLMQLQLFTALFMIILMFLAIIAGFFGYRFIKDLFENAKREISDIMESKIKETHSLMKNIYEKPFNRLSFKVNQVENYLKLSSKMLKSKDKSGDMPIYSEDETEEKGPGEEKNVFEE